MKIRDRLSLSFSFVSAIALLVFGFGIYFFFSLYRKSEFYNRLAQRIEVTEKMVLEKENFSEEAFAIIQQQFLNKLPEETEEVIELSESFRSRLKEDYPEEFLSDLVENGDAFFELSTRHGAGRIFHVKGKDYLVLLTAVDFVGIRLMDHFLTIMFIGLIVCVLSMILVSYFVSGRILNPIIQKIRRANSISAENLHDRLQVRNPDDELGQLAIAFNNLLDRVADAFEAQKAFIDRASHEIRNPLTVIIGEADYALERHRTDEKYISTLNVISEEADRLNSLVNSLLELSSIGRRQARLTKDKFSIAEALESSIIKLKLSIAQSNVQLSYQAGSDLLVSGDKHLLETAFLNLIDNACKFSFNKPVNVDVLCESVGKVTIRVTDTGIGIPEGDMAKVTQPFQRADNVLHISGKGIGVSLTAKIVELHGGSIHFKSQLNLGTEVTVTLPLDSTSQ